MTVLGLISFIWLANYVFLAFLAYLYKTNRPERVVVNDWPQVSIHVPIYNERYVAKRLLEAILNMDYPSHNLHVVIVDDSTDDTPEIVEEFVKSNSNKGIEIIHLRRRSRKGFKAGALQEALKVTKGEFVAIFDADFVPPRDFLKSVLPYLLADERVGAVQVRWGHLNRNDSSLTRGQALNLDLHFEIEQRARSSAGLFLNFNGTAGVWRRRCIEDSGGWGPFLAEDLELSVRAYLKGWKILYLSGPPCPGEVPPQMEAAKRQQFRWAYGAVEVARVHLLDVMRSRLGLGSKLQIALHTTRHLPYLFFLIVLLLTPLAVMLGVPSGGILASASWAIISALIVTISLGPKRLKEFPEMVLFTTSMTLNNARAILEAIFGIRRGFARTPKFGEGEWKRKRYVLPLDMQSYVELTLGAIALLTAFFSLLKGFYGYTLYTLIAGVSLVYAGALSIHHAPKAGEREGNRKATVLKWLIVALVVIAIFSPIYGYSQTYYKLDIAGSYLIRGASTSDADEIANYIERALDLIPHEGNPVWIFPTPRTDFAMIRSDLTRLLETARTLASEGKGSSTYQQGVDQIKDSLARIKDQVMEAAVFYYASPQALLLSALWLVAFIVLVRFYMMIRGKSEKGDDYN
jgi:cellulose synthase/poly-beta-1,6-N-acetylglucosamine synthase-like glycosyltransferase